MDTVPQPYVFKSAFPDRVLTPRGVWWSCKQLLKEFPRSLSRIPGTLLFNPCWGYMSGRRLRGCIAWFGIYSATFVALVLSSERAAGTLGPLTAFAFGLPAALLAYAFQARQAHLKRIDEWVKGFDPVKTEVEDLLHRRGSKSPDLGHDEVWAATGKLYENIIVLRRVLHDRSLYPWDSADLGMVGELLQVMYRLDMEITEGPSERHPYRNLSVDISHVVGHLDIYLDSLFD